MSKVMEQSDRLPHSVDESSSEDLGFLSKLMTNTTGETVAISDLQHFLLHYLHNSMHEKHVYIVPVFLEDLLMSGVLTPTASDVLDKQPQAKKVVGALHFGRSLRAQSQAGQSGASSLQ